MTHHWAVVKHTQVITQTYHFEQMKYSVQHSPPYDRRRITINIQNNIFLRHSENQIIPPSTDDL